MFKIGDKVKTTRASKCYYSADAHVADLMELDCNKWYKGWLTHGEGRRFTVVGKTFRPGSDGILVGIDDGAQQFIVDEYDLNLRPQKEKRYEVKYEIVTTKKIIFGACDAVAARREFIEFRNDALAGKRVTLLSINGASDV